jgi:hypothetical protein
MRVAALYDIHGTMPACARGDSLNAQAAIAGDIDVLAPVCGRDRQMPYVLLVITAMVMAAGFAKLGAASRPSNVQRAPLLVWALLLVLGIGISVYAARAQSVYAGTA